MEADSVGRGVPAATVVVETLSAGGGLGDEHFTEPIWTGLVAMRAGEVLLNCAEPSCLPSASL